MDFGSVKLFFARAINNITLIVRKETPALSAAMPNESNASKHKTSRLIKDVAGVILAGGKSSRFGKNKALVKLNGIPLLDRVISVMGSLFQQLVLITNTPDEYAYLHLPMHEDLIKNLGPLGGVYTGLTVIRERIGFFVGCDMPFLSPGLIRHMVETGGNFDVVVPDVSGKVEPLHGLYNQNCLPVMKNMIDSGALRINRFFPEVLVRYVYKDEIRKFDPKLRSFVNINRPNELKRLKKI